MMRSVILLLFLMSCSVVAQAQDDESSSQSVSATSFFKPKLPGLNIYLGNFSAAEDSQFTNIHNNYAFGMGLIAELNQYPHLAFELELFFINRDYDTSAGAPLWGTISDDTSVETSAALAGIRAFYPGSGPFRVYASTGLGFFRTRMVVYGSVLGFPGIHEDTSSTLDLYYGAGVSYMFGSWGLGLDYRHLDFDGSFSSFNIENANLGGDLYLLSWRRYF